MLKNYFAERATLLGYSGSATYWIMEHFETAAGIVLSVAMIVASIVLHGIKIRTALNREKREQEIHELKIKKERNG
ncbi:MAG: hypothetical protein KDC85_18330 [Saprospiraceae bacterium]|nr:hypothetical protein [Saprospiraceae bacterium]MCB9325893.1 hypothetical protein [Lewinellaceae bacterium]